MSLTSTYFRDGYILYCIAQWYSTVQIRTHPFKHRQIGPLASIGTTKKGIRILASVSDPDLEPELDADPDSKGLLDPD